MAQDQPFFDPERMYYDKWEMYRVIRDLENRFCRIPETRLLSRNSFEELTQRFDMVYIKPTASWGGKSILQIRKTAAGQFQCVRSDINAMFHGDLEQIWDSVALSYSSVKSVIQQGISSETMEGRPFDVRVHMQKDTLDKWVCAGTLVRAGSAGAIVSNVGVTGGSVHPFAQAIRTTSLHPSPERIAKLARQVRRIGHAVCHQLDTFAEFEEVGVDLGMGLDGRWWIFEVNTNDLMGGPSKELFRHLPNKSVYEAMVRRSDERTQQTLVKSLQILMEQMNE